MKRAISITLAGLALLTIGACAQLSSREEVFETVNIPGTGDSQDLLRELARLYASEYPGRRVVIPDSTGTKGGIEVVGNGASPVGRVARLPSAEERAQYGNFNYMEFARVPVVFVVSADTGVKDLSERKICDIWSGRVMNWREVGGNDLPVAVRDRPENGSNKQAIRENLACFADLKVASSVVEEEKNSDLVKSMKEVSGAIGFMPLSEARLHGFKTITINQLAGDTADYKLVIGLGFVYKNTLSPAIRAFFEYLNTETALQVIRETGHTPGPRHEVVVHAQSLSR